MSTNGIINDYLMPNFNRYGEGKSENNPDPNPECNCSRVDRNRQSQLDYNLNPDPSKRDPNSNGQIREILGLNMKDRKERDKL